jgi:hypothetical protein
LDTEGMKLVFELIGQWGFPIFVATYSLFKLNKTVEENTKVMIQIATLLNIKNEELGIK